MPADYKTLLGLVREFVESCEIEVDGMFGATTNVSDDLMVRAREAIKPSAPKSDPAILHMHAPAQCCSASFNRAARAGLLDQVVAWECPKCGTEWRAEMNDTGGKHWTPQEAIAIFRR